MMWSAMPRAFDRAADRAWIGKIAAKLGAALHSEAPQALPEPAGITEQCFEPEVPMLGGTSEELENRDPFARFDSQIRIAPGIVGLIGLSILGYNRISLMGDMVLGIAPGQSRADLVAGGLATLLFLQGLLWLSETPAKPELEDASLWEGVEIIEKFDALTTGSCFAAKEAEWIWTALSQCTRVSSMIVFWGGKCAVQAGKFRRQDAGGAPPIAGEFCNEVMSAGRGRYLSMLKNYPVKEQFYSFLPEQTRGLVLTPLRPARNAPATGLLVLGVDSVRGVGKVDQAWIGALAEKLAVSMAGELGGS